MTVPPTRLRVLRFAVPCAGLVLVSLLSSGCGRIPTQDGTGPSPSGTTASVTAEPSGSDPDPTGPGAEEDCAYDLSGTPARPVQPPRTTGVEASGTVTYTLKMTEGNVVVTLDRLKAPCTVNSFESLASQHFFDRTRCHRLVDSSTFLLQCGDPTGKGTGGPGYTFPNETDGTESYTAGVLAMANGADTNGSQFFLVYADSSALDANPDYTIFGTMDQASLGVVNRMAAEGQDGSNPEGGGLPNNPCEIVSVTKTG